MKLAAFDDYLSKPQIIQLAAASIKKYKIHLLPLNCYCNLELL
jgi:hypothetical protein